MSSGDDVYSHVLKFVPYQSFVDPGFWSSLSERKLHHLKLNEEAIDAHGHYTNTGAVGVPTRLTVDFDALSSNRDVPTNSFVAHGRVYVFNKLQTLKTFDPTEFMLRVGEEIWSDIRNGNALRDTSLLSRFLLVAYLDLKSFRYYHWFAFPALCYPRVLHHVEKTKRIGDVFTSEQISHIQSSIQALLRSDGTGFLLMRRVAWPGATGHNYQVLGNEAWACLRDDATDFDEYYLVFCDPSTEPDLPGWNLRNLLALFAYYRLAQGAVNLNLQLMRWRLVPDLNLDVLAATRCLLIGAGTLGCNVARNLLAWGISKLTLIDNGSVSYSNPVRQTLYTLAHCKQRKALVAAESLKAIYPLADVEGVDLTVPMPGHVVGEKELSEVTAAVERVEELIKTHDAVFLLSDTRESRWLPTMLGTFHRKIVITAALGYDTYVVMRHGFGRQPPGQPPGGFDRAVPGDQLGCYFCSDVVAPANSTLDRTLDQQCTVTRPGVSMIASAYAVELLVSLLQHPLGPLAPVHPGHSSNASLSPVASSSSSASEEGGPLGRVPHQLRGFLGRWDLFAPMTPRFSACPGCSEKVVSAYEEGGHPFLLNVFNSPPAFLEELTGLALLKETAENVEILELSDSDSTTAAD